MHPGANNRGGREAGGRDKKRYLSVLQRQALHSQCPSLNIRDSLQRGHSFPASSIPFPVSIPATPAVFNASHFCESSFISRRVSCSARVPGADVLGCSSGLPLFGKQSDSLSFFCTSLFSAHARGISQSRPAFTAPGIFPALARARMFAPLAVGDSPIMEAASKTVRYPVSIMRKD